MSTTVETAPRSRRSRSRSPADQIDDLRERIESTRWPSKELVDDSSQGVRLALLRELARYWREGLRLRAHRGEARRPPQYRTEIDGVQIHFIHVRSAHDNALPLVITHGWPGSFIEMLR